MELGDGAGALALGHWSIGALGHWGIGAMALLDTKQNGAELC